MKQDTKETIGSRGTVAGFRPLIGEERWHRDDFTAEMLEGGWRPLLFGEIEEYSDEYFEPFKCTWHRCMSPLVKASDRIYHRRTRRPLPPPQAETFEAHGHVWYRHVPGDAQPVEDSVKVDILWQVELVRQCYNPVINLASDVDWDTKGRLKEQELIGYRFPDFPAVHTTLQQEQPSAQPVIRGVGPYMAMKDVEKTMQSFQHDTTKQRLATMYHGWCDVAPDSVAECIADVAKVLYPTDADRCEAEFQKWWSDPDGVDSDPTAIWHAAWNAAKQQKL